VKKDRIEPLTWEGEKPRDFKCLICRKNQAKLWRIHEPWHLPVCSKCAGLPWGDIKAIITKK